MCSVDCWGLSQEYIRYGFQTATFEKNFEFLLSKPWIRLGILTTVNSLSIPTTVELAKKYQHWNSIREIFWHPHVVMPDSSPVNPLAFDYEFWKPYLDQLDQYLTEDTFNSKNTKDEFEGIKRLLASSNGDCIMQETLLQYLDAIDQRRNLNWRNIFPWLKEKTTYVV